VVKINNQDYVGSRCYNSTCEAFCALEIHHLQTYTSDPLVPGFEVKPTAQGYIVSSVPPELAAKTGFRPGDKILAIDGILLPLNTDRGSADPLQDGRAHRFTIAREGKLRDLMLTGERLSSWRAKEKAATVTRSSVESSRIMPPTPLSEVNVQK
jgi:predicted metalloprotease with PDZ domain